MDDDSESLFDLMDDYAFQTVLAIETNDNVGASDGWAIGGFFFKLYKPDRRSFLRGSVKL